MMSKFEVEKVFGRYQIKMNDNTYYYDVDKEVAEYIIFLQKENKRLEENNQAMQDEMAMAWAKLDKKEEIIKEAIDCTKDHIFQFDGDKDFEFLLQILERADK